MNYRLTAALTMASGLFACQQQAERAQDVDARLAVTTAAVFFVRRFLVYTRPCR